MDVGIALRRNTAVRVPSTLPLTDGLTLADGLPMTPTLPREPARGSNEPDPIGDSGLLASLVAPIEPVPTPALAPPPAGAVEVIRSVRPRFVTLPRWERTGTNSVPAPTPLLAVLATPPPAREGPAPLTVLPPPPVSTSIAPSCVVSDGTEPKRERVCDPCDIREACDTRDVREAEDDVGDSGDEGCDRRSPVPSPCGVRYSTSPSRPRSTSAPRCALPRWRASAVTIGPPGAMYCTRLAPDDTTNNELVLPPPIPLELELALAFEGGDEGEGDGEDEVGAELLTVADVEGTRRSASKSAAGNAVLEASVECTANAGPDLSDDVGNSVDRVAAPCGVRRWDALLSWLPERVGRAPSSASSPSSTSPVTIVHSGGRCTTIHDSSWPC